jgi:hypothetical protein
MTAISSDSPALPDRAETLIQVRAELRDNHPRLTDKQIDLIADVAVELRLAQMRFGIVSNPAAPPVSAPAAAPPPARARVSALVGDAWETRVGA